MEPRGNARASGVFLWLACLATAVFVSLLLRHRPAEPPPLPRTAPSAERELRSLEERIEDLEGRLAELELRPLPEPPRHEIGTGEERALEGKLSESLEELERRLELLEDTPRPPAQLGPGKRVLSSETSGRITGRVVDENGLPIPARTMLVGLDGGSHGGGATDAHGGFDLQRQFTSFQVKAWTDDGRVSVITSEDLGSGNVAYPSELRLEPGAAITVRLSGSRESCRIAMFTSDVRHSDFTLRKTGPRKEIVPAGLLYLEAYNGAGSDKVIHATRTLFVVAGRDESIELDL